MVLFLYIDLYCCFFFYLSIVLNNYQYCIMIVNYLVNVKKLLHKLFKYKWYICYC